MANNDIKQRIVLEGENEYKRALQDANRNLKTLRSSLKAETAELGNNATAQQKNQVKVKNLQQQIKEQTKVVDTYKAELEEVRKKYGDNEEAIAKYEQRLNSARTALANMKNELDKVDDGYEAVASGAKKSVLENNALAESFQRIGDIANSLGTGIESVFSGIVSTIKQTVGAVWGEITSLAAKADNYLDLASYLNTSATAVQKWDSALKATGNSMDTVVGLITKLKYNGDASTNLTNFLGISDVNYTDDLEYMELVMNRLAELREKAVKGEDGWTLEKFNQGLADAYGAKKPKEVEDLISDWEDILKGFETFDADNGGYGPSEDDLNNMAELNVQINTLYEKWTKLKEMATVRLFGDLAIRITGNLNNILDAFKDYMNADNDYAKKAALESIKRNVREMFEALRDAIEAGIEVLNDLAKEFKDSDNPTEQTLGNILQWIADTIAWLADPENWQKIKDGIMIVLGAWLFTKLAALVTAITSVTTSLKTIFGFKSAEAAASAAGAAANGGTATAASGGVAKTVAAAGGSGILHGGASAGGIGTGLAGGGSLSLVSALGGTAVIAAGVYALSEYVNSKNAEAQKMREVQADADRFTGYSDSEKHAIISAVRNLESMSAGSGTGKQLESLAGYMGDDLLKMFDYTNTSGEQRNKLMDMLDMDDQNAAVAAMMLHAVGIDTDQYGKYKDMIQNGSLDYAFALMTMQDFFNKSGYRDANGNWTIAGYNYSSGTATTDGNGVNIRDLSGWAGYSDRSKPVWSNRHLWYDRDDLENTWGESGTWADWWKNPTGNNAKKVEFTDGALSGMTKAFANTLSGVKVVMDGETVGRLVAPTVSQRIAREAQ